MDNRSEREEEKCAPVGCLLLDLEKIGGDTGIAINFEPEPKAELALKLKKAMTERKEKLKDENLLSRVAHEINEIEWPRLGRYWVPPLFSPTLFFGSSVILLTVNGVLAKLSNRVHY